VRRLRINDLNSAHQILGAEGVRYPGWSWTRIGGYHIGREEWDDAARAFARAIQYGCIRRGNIQSNQVSLLLCELALAFEIANEEILAVQHLEAVLRLANKFAGNMRWWFLLDIAELTFGMQSSNLGAIMLEQATKGAFGEVNDSQRVPLLCHVARIQHLVARDTARAEEALTRAMNIIKRCISDRVNGTIARCEIAETLHICGLDEQARRHLSGIFAFAESRTTRPVNKADEVIAEAALGHARAGALEGAKKLLGLIEDRKFDAAARAWATIHTYEGNDIAAEAAVSQIGNEHRSAKARRDLAEILARDRQVERALSVAKRIHVDRDKALPRIAMTFVRMGFREAFLELIVPATRFPNAACQMLAGMVRLHPEIAPKVSKLLREFVPDDLDF
jgi:hypothetical protein